MSAALLIAVFLAAFTAMEGVAWVTHRYLMHGPLWVLHRDHHDRGRGRFELNDLFAVFFALPAIVLIWIGWRGEPVALAAGLGITAYGFVYMIFHDGLVHRRFPTPWLNRAGFWRRRIQAHRLHHARTTRRGCVSFGFLWVSSPRALKAQLAQASIGSSSGADLSAAKSADPVQKQASRS